jgi:hypothetical protein
LFKELKDAKENPVFKLKYTKESRSPTSVREHARKPSLSISTDDLVTNQRRTAASTGIRSKRPPKLELNLPATLPMFPDAIAESGFADMLSPDMEPSELLSPSSQTNAKL